jgi:hypothetical protein
MTASAFWLMAADLFAENDFFARRGAWLSFRSK